MSEHRSFPFPTSVTRRERLTFSKHAGMQLQQLAEVLDAGDLSSITVEAEAALILIAAQRVDPSITFEQVLDNDGWVLAAPEVQTSDPLEQNLPAPSASTSSPT